MCNYANFASLLTSYMNSYAVMKKLMFLGMQERVRSVRILKNLIPVVMIADLIAAGLQDGYTAFNRPAMPEM